MHELSLQLRSITGPTIAHIYTIETQPNNIIYNIQVHRLLNACNGRVFLVTVKFDEFW